MQDEGGRHVLIFAGGGDGHVSGGVGRLLVYLKEHWDADLDALPVRVVDTRGHGRVGARALAAAAARLVAGAVSGRVACAHINMTTRGSAVRKGILCGLARLLGVPVILHLHGADFFEFADALPSPLRHLLRRAMLCAHTIIVIGAAWQQRLAADFGIPIQRIRVVANGVPRRRARSRPGRRTSCSWAALAPARAWRT